MSNIKEHLKIIQEALTDYRFWFDEEEYSEDIEKLKEIDAALNYIEEKQKEAE